jgi:hypothetical protein
MRRWSDGGEEIDEQLVFRVAAYAVKHRDPDADHRVGWLTALPSLRR